LDDEPDFLGGGDAVQTKPVEKKAKKPLPPPPAKTTGTGSNVKVIQKAVSNDIFDLDFLGGTEPTNNAPATNNNAQANLMSEFQAQLQPVQPQQQGQFGMQQQPQQQGQFGMQQQPQQQGQFGMQQQPQQQGQFGMQGQQQGQFGMQQQGQFGGMQGQQQGQFGGMQGQQQGQFGGMQGQQAQPKQTQFGTGSNLITFDKDPKPAEETDDDFSNFVTAEEEERKKEQQKVFPRPTKLKPLRSSKATPLTNRTSSI
jgi:hypothetical protein